MALNDPWLAAGLASLSAWIAVALARGRSWLEGPALFDDDRGLAARAAALGTDAPPLVVLVPARDEAAGIERSLGALLDQDYPGPWSVVLVDDESRDGTADRARACAARHPRGQRLTVLSTAPRPAGWVGKTWALECGLRAARQRRPVYLLLCDADVEHDPGNLRRLVALAEGQRRDLVSLMVLLRARGFWERLLIPAFVYFFQLLYPFHGVRSGAVAAAAGGCLLVRVDTLERAGGMAAVRDRVIDDCALAAAVRSAGGSLWLGLTRRARSFRDYRGLPGVWDMVARTAYTQLRHSPALLLGTAVGLLIVFAAPPAVVLSWPLHEDGGAALAGGVAWSLMAASQVATLRLYRSSPTRALLLPLAAALYLAMTLDSARRHVQGQGAIWKGRAGAGAGGPAGRRPCDRRERQ